jgi:hypothetical protein
MVYDLWPQELARYQLVTPNAGSVVLETQAQYDKHGLKQDDKHGLKQVDSATTPMMPTVPFVPEPSTATLLLSGSALLFRRRR